MSEPSSAAEGVEPVGHESHETEHALAELGLGPHMGEGHHGDEDFDWQVHGDVLTNPLDRSYFRNIAIGYAMGLVVFGLFVFFTLQGTTDWDIGVVVAVAFGVAFWVGLLFAAVLVAQWSSRNEHELVEASAGASAAGAAAHAARAAAPVDEPAVEEPTPLPSA